MEPVNKDTVAGMIDHALLHPTMGEVEMRKGCEIALKWKVASVLIKPYAVPMASDILLGSGVKICTVIGFPQGSSSSAAKLYETRGALAQGASEIDMVINIGKAMDRDWSYLRTEIAEINHVCEDAGGLLKVIFETDFLRDDQLKITLCEICSEIGVAYVKTSTGFGYVKDESGFYSYTGANEHDVSLMRRYCSTNVGVKASGNIRTLAQLLRFMELGATRIGTSSTEVIMAEAMEKFS